MNGGVKARSCAAQPPSDRKTPCLENPRPKAEYSLRENVASPVQAEPRHTALAMLARSKPGATRPPLLAGPLLGEFLGSPSAITTVPANGRGVNSLKLRSAETGAHPRLFRGKMKQKIAHVLVLVQRKEFEA